MNTGKRDVYFERDESGAWLARVPSVKGCHTYGRTLAQARARIREALSVWVDDAHEIDLVEHVRLPASARATLRRSEAARRRADRERVKAPTELGATARALVQTHGLSLRDAADLVGLSHQRVQQLVKS